MEFMTGVKEKETLELSELLEEGRLGEEVKVNGAVHTIPCHNPPKICFAFVNFVFRIVF